VINPSGKHVLREPYLWQLYPFSLLFSSLFLTFNYVFLPTDYVISFEKEAFELAKKVGSKGCYIYGDL